jgi:hypothetical protein
MAVEDSPATERGNYFHALTSRRAKSILQGGFPMMLAALDKGAR